MKFDKKKKKQFLKNGVPLLMWNKLYNPASLGAPVGSNEIDRILLWYHNGSNVTYVGLVRGQPLLPTYLGMT